MQLLLLKATEVSVSSTSAASKLIHGEMKLVHQPDGGLLDSHSFTVFGQLWEEG